MVDLISIEDIPPENVVHQTFEELDKVANENEPDFECQIGQITIKVYLSYDLSSNDPYVRVDSNEIYNAVIIINMNHNILSQISGSDGALNYYRECVYDGIAEHKARHRAGRTDPDTIKLIKDALFRIPFQLDAETTEGIEQTEE